MKIEIYSDVVCPWCFLGKRRLEAAIQSMDLQGVETYYLPHELNPSMPKEGTDRKKYLLGKYGPSIGTVDKRIESMGKEVGIEYHFDRASKIPNTFNAHRLIWLAGQENVQGLVMDVLFKAYFTEGKDLNDPKVLGELGKTAGLQPTKVDQLLMGQEGAKEVRVLEEEANHLGISGVPHFIFNREAELSGAHPIATFVSVLSELSASYRPKSE